MNPMAKEYEFKTHIQREGEEYNSMPLTVCGLVFETNDPIAKYHPKSKKVTYLRSRREVPENQVCLACLRIVGPCAYENIRYDRKGY